MDTRVRLTKAFIQDSIIQLVKEKPFHLIRLNEVCQLAQINRSTFYKYYHDLYDWKEQLEQECITQLAVKIEQSKELGPQETLRQTLHSIKKDEGGFSTICSPNFESEVMDNLMDMLLECATADLNKPPLPSDHTMQSEYWDRCFLIHGLSGVITSWYKNGMKESPDAIAECCSKYWQTISGSGCRT